MNDAQVLRLLENRLDFWLKNLTYNTNQYAEDSPVRKRGEAQIDIIDSAKAHIAFLKKM